LSTSVPFAVVDVFADAPLVGNALAVVTDAEGLEESVMRAVAREFNQSETTFVLPATQPGATWRLRSFTPAGAEVVGAGHNALGAWWWLATAGRLELDEAASGSHRRHQRRRRGRHAHHLGALPTAPSMHRDRGAADDRSRRTPLAPGHRAGERGARGGRHALRLAAHRTRGRCARRRTATIAVESEIVAAAAKAFGGG
jgi:Phenazine biosynthesis-like protein